MLHESCAPTCVCLRAGIPFDPNVASRHAYLGDVDELEGSYGHLPDGTTARLPLLVLDGEQSLPCWLAEGIVVVVGTRAHMCLTQRYLVNSSLDTQVYLRCHATVCTIKPFEH